MSQAPGTLKDALHNTIHRHPKLSVEAIAEQLGMATSYLYRTALPDPDTDGPDASGVRFPLKQLIPLIQITNDYQVLDLIENRLGRVGIPIPQGPASCAAIQEQAISAAADFGWLMQEVRQAVLDGTITKDELAKINKVGWVAISAIMQVIKGCEDK